MGCVYVRPTERPELNYDVNNLEWLPFLQYMWLPSAHYSGFQTELTAAASTQEDPFEMFKTLPVLFSPHAVTPTNKPTAWTDNTCEYNWVLHQAIDVPRCLLAVTERKDKWYLSQNESSGAHFVSWRTTELLSVHKKSKKLLLRVNKEREVKIKGPSTLRTITVTVKRFLEF